jgi:hypothetical protein
MTDPKCPACETVNPSHGVYKYTYQSCTGRPGCVRTAPVPPVPATSGVDSGASPIMPDGWDQNAQPTDTLLLALSMGMKVGPAVAQQAADEIARLRAEVERLTGRVDHWIGYARTTETHAARLEDRRADLAARAADLTLKAQAVAKADRAALAKRVAEAVREACAAVAATHSRRSSLTNYNFTANTRDDQAAMAAAAFVHDEIIAIDTAAIVAAALAKEGE